MRRIIHQIWFQGESNIPDKHKESVESLKRMNPSWRHVMWDETTLRATCLAMGRDVAELFDAYTHMHQKIDLGRYCVLHEYGGVSVDVDVTPLRPFDTLLHLIDDDSDKILVSRINAEKWEMIAANALFQGTLQNTTVNNAIIIAPRPGNLALHHLVRSLVCEGARSDNGASKMQQIMATTGPPNFTHRILQRRQHVKILDPKYFEPCVGYDISCGPSKDSVLYHQHDGTWLEPHTRTSAAYYYHLKSHAVMHGLLITCVLLVLALVWTVRRKL